MNSIVVNADQSHFGVGIKPSKFPGEWQWVGVAFEGKTMALAHVVGAKHRPRVLWCVKVTMKDGDDQSLNQRSQRSVRFNALHSAIEKQKGVKSSKVPCSIVLESGDYETLTPDEIDIQGVDENQMRQALRWAVQPLVSFPMDNASLDVLIDRLESRQGVPDRQKLTVVAASESTVSSLMTASLDASINLKAIDVPEAAQRNLAHLAEKGSEVLAMLVFSAHRALLTISAEGKLLMTRTLEIMDCVHMSDLENDVGNMGDMGAGDRFCTEVERTLNNFKRQNNGHGIHELLVFLGPQEFFGNQKQFLIEKFEKMSRDMQENFIVSIMTPERISQMLDVEESQSASGWDHLQLLAIGAACRGTH